MRAFYIFFLALILVSCHSLSQLDRGDFDTFLQRAAHSPKETGDFGAFFVQQVSRYGGQTSSAVPKLSGTWYSESDYDGFAAQLYDVSFAQARSFMQQVYGSPLEIATNAPLGWGLYGVHPGAAIQFFGDTNGVGFICFHSQSHKKKP